MDRKQHSFETYALLQAAMDGDEEGTRRALDGGADVNATDASGRTALTNAITGESWQSIHTSDAFFMSQCRLNILSILASREDISLHTLNAPQEIISGVCPLGMCAWLNMPTAVQTLLDSGAGRTCVDGADSLGATPLMCQSFTITLTLLAKLIGMCGVDAARDGNLDVVQQLLAHGARPDSRDINHRTAIQHALRHSEALWMCETILKRARCRTSEVVRARSPSMVTIPGSDDLHLQPFPTSDAIPRSSSPSFPLHHLEHCTDRLIRAILSTDVTAVKSLLSSTSSLPASLDGDYPHDALLVNKPNAQGWSPIHYCMAAKEPSLEVLNALYFAGADTSLFTANEYYTPLHCLATRACLGSYSLHSFIVHLVRDLRAPLSARDRENETCIHLAAEHGATIDVLKVLLECDHTGSVRNLRNSRGLTALEVAKREYQEAFGPDADEARPRSSASMRTIRPSVSLATMSPMYVPRSSIESTRSVELSPPVPSDFDVLASSTSFLEALGHISAELGQSMHPTRIDELTEALSDAKTASCSIFAHLRAQVDDARKEMQVTLTTLARVDNLWAVVARSAECSLRCGQFIVDDDLLEQLTQTRRLRRPSADSQATAVSVHVIEAKGAGIKSLDNEAYFPVVTYRDASTCMVDNSFSISTPTTIVHGTRTVFWPEWLEHLIPSPENSATSTPSEAERHDFDFFHRGAHSAPRRDVKRLQISHATMGTMKSTKDKGWEDSKMAVKSAVEVTAKNGPPSGSSRFKTWFKKIIPEHKPHKVEIVLDIDETRSPVGREAKSSAVDHNVRRRTAMSIRRSTRAPKQPLDAEMHAHIVALITASRDITSIEGCLEIADQFITTADRSLARAQRIAQRILASRASAIQHLQSMHEQTRSSSPPPDTKYLLPPQNLSDLYERSASPTMLGSANTSPSISRRTSCVSLLSASDAREDEDTRALRGLLLRKINARLDGSFDEIDKAGMWLRIVREVVRVVMHRAQF